MKKVFIIVLNWNGKADTIECVESLKNIDYPDYKIVIVDNGSTDDSVNTLPKKYFQDNIAFIATKKNLGFSGGNNIGINYALKNGADYILLLNNDTTVEPDFLSELVKAGEADEKTGILGPKIMFYSEKELIWSAGGKISKNFSCGELVGYKEKDQGQFDEKKEVDYISGTCLLIKKEVVEKIGPMSEDYFLYYEDTDWNLRARRAGFKRVFVPQSKIYHKVSRVSVEFSYPYIYYLSRNGLMLASRYGSKIITYPTSFWIFSKQIIKIIIGYKREWARPVAKGVMDFWKGKKGKLEGFY
ncbi:MAG: glycosyltransferase family 2 protein [Candidatus Portnoybacteria bacterium]|nr:glycosyltransferase family 2 protein [Candidatus Portnoybacteria bacterium]